MGNSESWFARMLRYRKELHSENFAGKVVSWLCDKASLRSRISVAVHASNQ